MFYFVNLNNLSNKTQHLFIGSVRQTAYSKALDVKKLVVQLKLNDQMLVGNT